MIGVIYPLLYFLFSLAVSSNYLGLATLVLIVHSSKTSRSSTFPWAIAQ